jgi:hypothetical protein
LGLDSWGAAFLLLLLVMIIVDGVVELTDYWGDCCYCCCCCCCCFLARTLAFFLSFLHSITLHGMENIRGVLGSRELTIASDLFGACCLDPLSIHQSIMPCHATRNERHIPCQCHVIMSRHVIDRKEMRTASGGGGAGGGEEEEEGDKGSATY